MNPLISLATVDVKSDFLKLFKSLKGDGLVMFLDKLIGGLFIILIGWIILKLAQRSLRLLFKKSSKISSLMNDYVQKIFSVIGWVIILGTFISHIGVDMAPLIAGLGVTSVILGFAFQDSLSNFFAGAMIVLNEPFRKEDYIEVGSLSGTVKNMDLMCVTLSPPDGKKITLSNKYVWSQPIINYSYTTKRGVSITVGVSYSSNLKVCKQVFEDMLASYPEVLDDPKPIVEVQGLADSSINFLIRPWVKPEDYWKVYWRFHSEVVEKLAEKGMSVPFPQLDVHFDKDSLK